MKNYVKPMVLVNEELAEGVYAASGCLTASISLVNTDTNGAANKARFNVRLDHNSNDAHISEKQKVVIKFSTAVNVVETGGSNVSGGNGSDSVTLVFPSRLQNYTDGRDYTVVVEPVNSGISATAISAYVVSSEDCV